MNLVQLANLQKNLRRILDMQGILNDPETICILAQSYYFGEEGSEQSFENAAALYKIAAELNYADAQHSLALQFENGEGVERNISEAIRWYEKAVAQNHPGSCNNLGALYEMGNGTNQDFKKALYLYKKASDLGDKNGKNNYSRINSIDRIYQQQELIDFLQEIHPMLSKDVLIGDASKLLYSKKEILNKLCALRYLIEEDIEKNTAEEQDGELINILHICNMLLNRLVRDWHVIDAEDKPYIFMLEEYEEFPDWAEHLKDKYINEKRASEELFEATANIMINFAK